MVCLRLGKAVAFTTQVLTNARGALMPFNSAYKLVEVGKAPMPEFRFDPPLTLKGNVVVRNLDDAVRFMIGYREARRRALQTSVLYRLERAVGEADERHAGYAFRGWAEAETSSLNLANKRGRPAQLSSTTRRQHRRWTSTNSAERRSCSA
jgi:hypothetical protein